MKSTILISTFFLFLITGMSAQNGVAKTIRNKKSRETTVTIEINNNPSVIWSLLTNAPDYPKWNSTIISIDGNIKLNEKIKLKSILAPKKSFKLKIKEYNKDKKLVWGDKKGNRTFTLTNLGNGKTTFTMSEIIGGFMFNMYANKIPSFDQNFEQFAADLKKAAESK